MEARRRRSRRTTTHLLRLAPVFDVAQVDPISDFPGGAAILTPPITPLEGDSLAHLLEPLAGFGASIGSPVTVQPVPGHAFGYYDVESRRIVVDIISDDFYPKGQIKTLIHELAHALVRYDHQDDDPSSRTPKKKSSPNRRLLRLLERRLRRFRLLHRLPSYVERIRRQRLH